MARHPAEPRSEIGLTGRLVARYLRFVAQTSTLVVEPAEHEAFLAPLAPAIIALWHGQFLLSHMVKPADHPVRAVIAPDPQSSYFAGALAHLGIEAAAVSVPERAVETSPLAEAEAALAAGISIAIAADTAPGPARRSGMDIVTLAMRSGRPIVPLAVATSRYRTFNTWSRLTLNLPFSRMAGVFGQPIRIAADADAAAREAARTAVEAGLDRATRRACELAGATPPAVIDDSAPCRTAPPGKPLAAYKAVTRLAVPAAPVLLGMREQRGREDRARRAERLGEASQARPPGHLVWVHAASVGETNAVLPVIARLREARPDLTCLLTTGTVTSAAVAAQRLGPRDIHQYVPLDFTPFVARFLDHWRPDLAVFTESEIWPNLIIESAARHIPLALVNARMSDRSYARWRRFRSISRPLIGRFDLVLAQNDKLARRFADLGARRSLGLGNLKVDAPPPPVDRAALTRLQDALAGRPVLLAASTHDGEELIVAEAHRQLAVDLPGLLTIIVPRHPERGTGIAEALKAQGFAPVQRSTGALPGSQTGIYIADTLGELGTFYALADVAYIGGSLVDRGGQNPIEAIRHDAAVLTGPHWHNFRDAYRVLLDHGGAHEVTGAADLSAIVRTLAADPAALSRMRTAGRRAVDEMSGALERTVAELLALLPQPTPAEIVCATP